MADDYLSLQRFPGDGVTTDFTVSFAGGAGDTQQGTHPYIDITDVKAYELVPTSGTEPSQRIPRTVEILGPLAFRVAPAVPVGRVLELSRESEDRYNLVDFRTLQTVSEFDLDLAVRQLLYVTQESSDRSSLALTGSEEANLVAADALNVAGNAFTQSNEALDVSGQALTRSNSAISIANAATNTANSASNAAAQAVDTANDANSTAGTALSTANSAASTADDASSTADAASIAAGQATNTANNALGTANSALTLANTAITTSDDALDVAEDALTVAEAAEISAGAATDTANNAEQVALGISDAVDAAVITANTAFDMAEDAIQAVESAGVASFNGRAGLVLPESGDYAADMVEFGAGTVADELGALSDRVDNTTSIDDVQDWWTGTGNQARIGTVEDKLATVEEGAEVNTVTSVHGRTGDVTAQSGDYSVAQITGSEDLVNQVDRPSLERYPSVQSAFGSTTSSTLWGIPGKVYNYVSSSTPNPLGIQVPSEAILRDTATREIVNPYTHREMVWGQEFLHNWYDHIRTSLGAGGTVHFSGDSTTAGNGITDPSYQLQALFNRIAQREGILTPSSAVNRGFPSESTENLKNLRALQVTAQAVSGDVVVLRWGLNDPFYGIPIETTAANLEASILTLKSVAGISIVLMTPNAADTPSDGVSPRNAVWSEKMQRVVRRLAFKHGCAFIDTYGLFQNAERGSDKWLDTGKLHPRETLNALIASKVFEVLVPAALLAKYGGRYTSFHMTLSSPWTNVDPGLESAKFIRDGNNIVTLTGLVFNEDAHEPHITTIGVLPVGYRPDSTRRFAVFNSIIAIDSLGTVMNIGESYNGSLSSGFLGMVGLDGISFKAVVP